MKKIYSFILALICAVSVQAADYYLIGGFNNWTLKDAKCLFTPQGDGTYVLDYDGTLTPSFKINDGTWSNDNANFGAGTGRLVLGQTYTLKCAGNSGNIMMDENVANPHIVFNPTACTLLITGQSQDVTYCYGIHGEMFTGSNWTTQNMTEENGKWVLTAEFKPGSFGIKQMDASTMAQTAWLSSASDDEFPAFTEYNLGQPQTVMEEGKNWSFALEGEYTLTFDPEAMTLTATKVQGIASVEADDNTETVYYNLQGVEVDATTPGLYIAKRGAKVSKVIVK